MLPVFVAEKVGITPETGFECASSKVMVIAEVLVPSAVILETPVIVEVVAEGEPELKVTTFPVTLTGELKVRVFASASVDVNVQVETPVVALETEQVP